MKKTIITVAITLAVLIAGFFLFIISGVYDISQLTPHYAFTKSLINLTKHRSIDRSMKDVVVPGNLKDSLMIITGFKHYNEMCVVCHGAPNVKPDEMAEGLYPKPPRLFKRNHEEEAQEFFWIIKNGIKLTSMPAYAPTHNDEKIWAITAFVTQMLPKMTPDEYKAWVKKYAGENEAKEMHEEKD